MKEAKEFSSTTSTRKASRKSPLDKQLTALLLARQFLMTRVTILKLARAMANHTEAARYLAALLTTFRSKILTDTNLQ